MPLLVPFKNDFGITPKCGLCCDGGPQQRMPRLVLLDEVCPTPRWKEGFPLNYSCVITFRFRPTGRSSLLLFSPNAVLQMLAVYRPWLCFA